MRGFRFSIARLMGIVAVVAAAVAVSQWPTEWAASMVLIVAFGTLLSAILGIVCARGQRRAFWLGMALFGWFYIVVAVSDWFPRIKFTLEQPLSSLWSAINGGGPARVWRDGAQLNFVFIAHFLAAVLAGGIGGIIGRVIYARSWERESDRREG